MIIGLVTVVGSIVIGMASGGYAAHVVMENKKEKKQEIEMDHEMEILLRNSKYLDLEDWRNSRGN